MSYIDLKTLHMLGVMLFLGNIIVTAFQPRLEVRAPAQVYARLWHILAKPG